MTTQMMKMLFMTNQVILVTTENNHPFLEYLSIIFSLYQAKSTFISCCLSVALGKEQPMIINQPKSWYSIVGNRWVAFIGVIHVFILLSCL